MHQLLFQWKLLLFLATTSSQGVQWFLMKYYFSCALSLERVVHNCMYCQKVMVWMRLIMKRRIPFPGKKRTYKSLVKINDLVSELNIWLKLYILLENSQVMNLCQLKMELQIYKKTDDLSALLKPIVKFLY